MYNQLQFTPSHELVEQYAPLVKRIAQHLMARLPASVQLDDLIQSGMIGLLEAASKYDMSKGASFETYAGIRIRGAIIDEVRRGDWTPRSVHRNGRRVAEAMRQIESREGRDASDREVADELGISLSEYHALLQDSMEARLFSVDELTEESDEGSALQFEGDNLSPSDEVSQDAFRSALVAAIGDLPEKERLVLALYYDEELNLKEIGSILGVSESRVSQIHSQAALRLRSRLKGWN